MAVCRCWDCGFEKRYNTVEEARAGARLHMGLTPHLMVFGYTDAKYKEAQLDEAEQKMDTRYG